MWDEKRERDRERDRTWERYGICEEIETQTPLNMKVHSSSFRNLHLNLLHVASDTCSYDGWSPLSFNNNFTKALALILLFSSKTKPNPARSRNRRRLFLSLSLSRLGSSFCFGIRLIWIYMQRDISNCLASIFKQNGNSVVQNCFNIYLKVK